MKSIKDLTNGDIVLLKTGAIGVVSKIIHSFFGDDEAVYEIQFFNNKTSIRRSKDFAKCI